jgi:hypothetical protein
VSEVEGQVRSEELDAEREARRRVALAQIRQYPDPVLRLVAKEVEEVDETVAGLVERMAKLMQEARGVGLAAPRSASSGACSSTRPTTRARSSRS